MVRLAPVFLPWVLILGCVGMHLFMHGGRSHGGGHSHGAQRDAEPGADSDKESKR